MYPLSWLFAAELAKLGVPLAINVTVIYDDEAKVYIATSADLKGLVVEAETLDDLAKEVAELVPELLALNKPTLHAKASTHLSFVQPLAL